MRALFCRLRSLPDALQKLSVKPLAFKPGEKTRYNGTEYLLLRMVLGKLSGKTFGDFLEERIFQPLGMKTAQFADARDIIPRKVPLYSRWSPDASRREFEVRNATDVVSKPKHQKWIVPLLYPEPVRAGAGLVMNAIDLAKFDAALTAKTLLNAHTLEQMWAPIRLTDGKVGEFIGGTQVYDTCEPESGSVARMKVYIPSSLAPPKNRLVKLLDDCRLKPIIIGFK